MHHSLLPHTGFHTTFLKSDYSLREDQLIAFDADNDAQDFEHMLSQLQLQHNSAQEPTTTTIGLAAPNNFSEKRHDTAISSDPDKYRAKRKQRAKRRSR